MIQFDKNLLLGIFLFASGYFFGYAVTQHEEEQQEIKGIWRQEDYAVFRSTIEIDSVRNDTIWKDGRYIVCGKTDTLIVK